MGNELRKWYGRPGIYSLKDEMDRTFDRFFRDWDTSDYFPETLTPPLNVSETKDKITVKTEVPGVDPKEINISIQNNTLVIKGEKKSEKEENDENYHRVECRYGTFSRSVVLPGSVDPDKVTAECKNGVLVITLLKKEEAKSKQITIKTN